MPFKITDLRVGRKSADGSISVYIAGLGPSTRLAQPTDTFRASLMLNVFNLRRTDCYFDEAETMMTTTVPFNDPATSPVHTGRVTGWDIRIPASGQPQLYLHLHQPTAQSTSGDAANGWAIVTAPERDIAVALALASSKYCFLSSVGLRNTDFFQDLPGWPAAEPPG